MAKPLGLEVKTNLNDMQIGDCIPCRYTATSGVAGTFSELGTCTASEIPIASSATPDGLFYFIKVDKGTLIADRVVQCSISWDALNATKYIEGQTIYNSAIPLMTSNTSPSGIANASSYIPLYPPFYAFDKSIASGMWSTPDGTATGWISYKFTTAKIIRKYSITSSLPTRSPKTWEFQGSNDGYYWTPLDTQNNITGWGYSDTKSFTINNKQSFTYYRINVTSVVNDTYVQIKEMDMFEGESIGTIRSLSGGCAYADSNGNPSLTDKSLGAWPINNEWDKYIVNSDLDGKIAKGDNNVWNWNTYSKCKETPVVLLNDNAKRIMRGYVNIKNLSHGALTSATGLTAGFRPVLNYIESDIASEVIY